MGFPPVPNDPVCTVLLETVVNVIVIVDAALDCATRNVYAVFKFTVIVDCSLVVYNQLH